MADCCSTETKLIYSCSGAADVGEIADRVARKLRTDGSVQMSCLAGISAGLSGYIHSAKGTDVNITIDGCKTACAKKTLEKIGVSPKSYVLTSFGLVKGETPVTEKIIAETCEKIKNTSGNTVPLVQINTYGGSGDCKC